MTNLSISEEAKHLAYTYCDPHDMYDGERFDEISLRASIAIQQALNNARNNAFEDAAKIVMPKGKRRCDCDSCYCGNVQDAEDVASWDSLFFAARAILAMKVG